MVLKYRLVPAARPEATFPFTKLFIGKEYRQSLVNPIFVKDCTLERAEEAVKRLHREGWAARIAKFATTSGVIYLVYERRTGREMRPKKGHKVLFKELI